jgi:death-on-curing protein
MSSEIKFLTFDQVLKLHSLQIDEFGGLDGVKNEGLLRSALAQPESGFGEEYFHKTIYEMAAAYLFHLAKNHAFHDGNKRIAAVTAAVFLQINGYSVIAEEDEFEKIVIAAASGSADKEMLAEFFKRNTRSR